MAAINLTNGHDRRNGTNGADTLNGLGGNDRIAGLGGNDTLLGGTGNDQLLGGAGNDLLRGGAGNDRLQGDAGNDRLLGESGNDTLLGGAGNDQLLGGAGNDQLRGGTGNDLLRGDAGNDSLLGENGHDTLLGGAGNDRLNGGAGNDRLVGEQGSDILTGGSGADTFAVLSKAHGLDKITDFRLSQGDTLDLSKALQGFDFGDDLGDFVRFRSTSAGTTVSIDTTGKGTAFTPVLLLEKVQLDGLTAGQMGLESLPSGVTLVSTEADGSRDAGSGPGVISGDGRFVAFASSHARTDDDTSIGNDIYVKDMLTGRVIHASADADGDGADQSAVAPLLAGNGRHVLFESTAGNLDPDDNDNLSDLFWKDVRTGAIQRVNEDADGDRFSFDNPDITANGRFVVFDTLESLAPGDDGGFDVYVKDMLRGTFERVSTTSNGGDPNSGSIDPSISADGRYVAFTSLATNLVAGDSFTDFDVFVKDRQTGAVQRVSVDARGGEPDGEASHAVISGNGRFVLFESDATDLVAGDVDNGEAHLFVRDLLEGSTVRVSESATGTPSNGFDVNGAISADGRFVVFESNADNLVAGDDNGRTDIFVRDMILDRIARVNVDADGDNLTPDNNGSKQRPDISDDGHWISFDGSADVFFAENPLFPTPDLTGAAIELF